MTCPPGMCARRADCQDTYCQGHPGTARATTARATSFDDGLGTHPVTRAHVLQHAPVHTRLHTTTGGQRVDTSAGTADPFPVITLECDEPLFTPEQVMRAARVLAVVLAVLVGAIAAFVHGYGPQAIAAHMLAWPALGR